MIIIISAVLVFVFAAGVSMLATFFPYKGKDSVLYWTPDMEYNDVSHAASQKIYKESGKDFKIIQFTDVQLDYDVKAMKKAKELVRLGIEKQKPDLIVFTGDTVQGPLGHYQLKKFVKYMDSFKVPYMPVFGNHERDSVTDMNYMSEIWESGECCLFTKGPRNVHGYGNYFVNVVEKQPDNSEKIVYILSAVDTGGKYKWEKDKDGNAVVKSINGETLKADGYDYDIIYPDQISYYEWQVKKISEYAGYTVPSMVFTHIPVPEFETAWEQWAGKNTDYDFKNYNPSYVENITIPAEDGFGRRYEDIGAGKINSGFFTAAKNTGSLTHIFAGHEHVNNFSILYEGVRLTYGQKTGTCSYSRDDMQGHTLITLTSETRGNGFYNVNVMSYQHESGVFQPIA